MDELSHINVLYNDTKTELDSCKADQAELEELREMKEDVKRKEKQQQAIIENQVRGVALEGVTVLFVSVWRSWGR